MLVGIFADAHDHADNVRRTVRFFNETGVGLVLFAGDLVSPLVVPPLRKLHCPLVACFGDNDGNRRGIEGGMRVVGPIGDPPFCVTAPDGTRFLLCHQLSEVRELLRDAPPPEEGGPQVVVYAHTHRHAVAKDSVGRLFVNPGECGGWVTRTPSVAIVETTSLEAKIVPLPQLGPAVVIEPV
ncbi:YfcE family phosphodiesterase [Alienimonas californiensis]|uniref:Phosphoesterase n=1 Tax=Alienimonas californiensis TaxID=2527989 RepID=A0A517PAV5_9PLAN|nr:YfcE family phosphodiesterase [Alienimonas californiensis]QDT16512.1 Calcineurin-like phosphoesterase superfamily domain protein [Alienimonas californiensis]